MNSESATYQGNCNPSSITGVACLLVMMKEKAFPMKAPTVWARMYHIPSPIGIFLKISWVAVTAGFKWPPLMPFIIKMRIDL